MKLKTNKKIYKWVKKRIKNQKNDQIGKSNISQIGIEWSNLKQIFFLQKVLE
jgi:hypothetical protein